MAGWVAAPGPALPGLTIGLLGGSFDPAHAGHLHASLTALKALRLDYVWWLVSPGNPLKSGPAPLAARPRLLRRRMEIRSGARRKREDAEQVVKHGLHTPWRAGVFGKKGSRVPVDRKDKALPVAGAWKRRGGRRARTGGVCAGDGQSGVLADPVADVTDAPPPRSRPHEVMVCISVGLRGAAG